MQTFVNMSRGKYVEYQDAFRNRVALRRCLLVEGANIQQQETCSIESAGAPVRFST